MQTSMKLISQGFVLEIWKEEQSFLKLQSHYPLVKWSLVLHFVQSLPEKWNNNNYFVSFYKDLCDNPEGDLNDLDPNAGRFVRYQFTPHFLKLRTVGAT